MSRLGDMLFRMSLLLLPASLRRRHGGQMRATFAELQARSARERGVLTLPALWVREIGGVLVTAWRARRPPRRMPFTAGRTLGRRAGRWPSATGVDALLQDVRYGLRALRSSRGFTLTALVTLALGIGANTAIFSVVYATLLRPLALPHGDRVVFVFEDHVGDGSGTMQLAPHEYIALRDAGVPFEQIAAYMRASVKLIGDSYPIPVSAIYTEPGLLSTLGLEPALGRFFVPEDAQDGTRAVVVSHAMWQQQLGGDPGVVGTTLRTVGGGYTVIGVAPPELSEFDPDLAVLLPHWVEPGDPERQSHFLLVVGRIRSDVARAAAVQAAQEDVRRLRESTGIEHDPMDLRFVSARARRHGDVRRALLVLTGAVGTLLLVACANVANLQLARGVGRQRELAIRRALGAGKLRIARQLLTESVLVALAGGLLGAGCALLGLPLLLRRAPGSLNGLPTGGMSLWLLGFTAALSIVVAIVSGLVPALAGGSRASTEGLRAPSAGGTGRRTGSARRALMVVQVALALVLLIGAGLLARTFAHLRGVDVGFDAAQTITGNLDMGGAGYREPGAVDAFYEQTLESIRALPGIQGAAIANGLPGWRGYMTMEVAVDGSAGGVEGPEQVNAWIVSSGYFDVLRIPLVAGRDLDADDEVVVNEAFARRHWPGQSSIGRSLLAEGRGSQPLHVVGVVGDVRDSRFDAAAPPRVYLPLRAYLWPGLNLVARFAEATPVPPDSLRTAIARVDPNVPLTGIGSLDQALDRSIASERFNAALMSTIAALALALASVGVYGVVSYSVSQRTQELGVRMALGSSHGRLVALVVRQGLTPCLIGAGAGLGVAWLLSGLLRSLLHGVSPTDSLTYAGVAATLVAAALLASYLPARRAASVDPVQALRQE